MRNTDANQGGASPLAAAEPPAFTIFNASGSDKILVICDHAAVAVPRTLGRLGLDEINLAQHIGWDIGAASVVCALADRLGAPAVLAGYSRLVIDCNRALDDATSIPTISDGLPVPGNQELSAVQKRARADAYFWPYHHAIEDRLERASAQGLFPAVISLHSFTPRMQGFDRPWEIGILWDRDPRIAVPLIANLSALSGLVIGDNQPYSARDPEGFTLRHHAVRRGLPHVLIELRQDEIDTDEGALRYAGYLETALRPILDDPKLYRGAIYP